MTVEGLSSLFQSDSIYRFEKALKVSEDKIKLPIFYFFKTDQSVRHKRFFKHRLIKLKPYKHKGDIL